MSVTRGWVRTLRLLEGNATGGVVGLGLFVLVMYMPAKSSIRFCGLNSTSSVSVKRTVSYHSILCIICPALAYSIGPNSRKR